MTVNSSRSSKPCPNRALLPPLLPRRGARVLMRSRPDAPDPTSGTLLPAGRQDEDEQQKPDEARRLHSPKPFSGHQISSTTTPRIRISAAHLSRKGYGRTVIFNLSGFSNMCAAFSDLSAPEVELVAETLKGTTWLAIFSRVSKTCRSAAIAKDEASPIRLKVRDVVCSVELVKWAVDQGYPREKERVICEYAARGGFLETLKWLRASGCEWFSGACAAAAEGGHLDVLKWLRANGCPWNDGVCSCAAGEATWKSLSGPGPTDVLGNRQHVLRQH